jgi:hypothetical protein
MTLTFTLQSAYTGSTYVAGPFNISGHTSGGADYQLATGITKSQLTTGYSINTVYETITGGTIVSTGTCNTSHTWSLTPAAAATSTLSYSLAAGVYTFNLTNALNESITISDAAVNLYTNSSCTSPMEDQALLATTVTILSGTTTATYNTTFATTWNTIVKQKQNSFIILNDYGTKTNNQTFTTPSGTVVSVSLNTACISYPR